MEPLILDYLKQCRCEGLSTATIASRRSVLFMLIKYLRQISRKAATEITSQDLTFYFDKIQHLRPSVRRSRASIVRGFFRWLVDNSRIIFNPALDICVPAESLDPLPVRPLEEAEILELFEHLPRRNVIDVRNRLHLELLYSCGLRISESLQMNIHDIDLQAGVLTIRHGKGDKARQLPLMRGVSGALQDYLTIRRHLLKGPDHGALLLNTQGRRLTQGQFRNWLKELNAARAVTHRRALHPHLLRHSIAVHLLRAGADVRYIQEFLGHDHLNTTKIYLRLVPERLRADYDNAMPQIPLEL